MLDTLSFYQKHPLLIKRDHTGVSAHRVAQRMRDFLTADTKKSPDQEAINFYLSNHAIAEVLNRVPSRVSLGKYEPIVVDYLQHQANSVARMFYYLFIICTRESRHVYDMDGMFASLETKFGAPVKHWFQSLQGSGSNAVFQKLKSSAPDIPMGVYTEALVHIFYKGKFSGGYGGPKWGAVADVLKAFTHGEISGEAMMDTGFTLAHNNGPIFNKGMLYEHYSNELTTLLDVQRAGLIPNLIQDFSKGVNYVQSGLINNEHVARFSKYRKVLGDSFGGVTDWWLVEALGGLKTYAGFKKIQEKHYGKPASVAAIEEKAKAMQAAAAAIAAEEAKKWFHIMPATPHSAAQKVKKLARAELAAA